MSSDLTWGYVARRLFSVLRQRFTASVPDCIDCGFPMERMSRRFARATWGDGAGHCVECAALIKETERAKARAAPTVAAATVAMQDLVVRWNHITDSYGVTSGEWIGATPGAIIPVKVPGDLTVLVPHYSDNAETEFERKYLEAFTSKNGGHVS